MGCYLRNQGQPCNHYICPYPDRTDHGYECVDIVGGFCEVGEDCYQECAHAWQSGTEKASQAELAFIKEYGNDFQDEPFTQARFDLDGNRRDA